MISFFIAFYTAGLLSSPATNKAKKRVLFIVPLIGSLSAIYVFLNPDLINTGGGDNETIGSQYAIGPYPELPKMYELKAEGFSGVISLLHPAVVPFEPALINKEKENAREAGLEFINIPFLPWISDNKQAIDTLRHLIKTGKGKYYIHCYLGRDRISVASRIVKQEKQDVVDYGSKINEGGLIFKKLERGAVEELEKDVFLAPQPTKEEYLDVVDDFAHVVVIGDEKNASNSEQLQLEKKWLEPFKVPIASMNLTTTTSESDLKSFVAQVKSLPKPVFIHGYQSSAKEMEKFKQAYLATVGK